MSFSPELHKLVSNFQTIDPAGHSINESLEQTGKRTWLQNALGFLCHIITCGLIAKNPELDRATKKIVSLTKEFFRQAEAPSQDQLRSLQTTFSKLETIISENQGSRYSQVHELAERVNKLLTGNKEDPTKDQEQKIDLLPLLDAFTPVAEEPTKEAMRNLYNVLTALKKASDKNDIASLAKAFTHIQTDKDKFLALCKVMSHFMKDFEQAKLLISSIQWPEAESRENMLQELEQRWPTPEQRDAAFAEFEAMIAGEEDIPNREAEPEVRTVEPEQDAPDARSLTQLVEAKVDNKKLFYNRVKDAVEQGDYTDFFAACQAAQNDEAQLKLLVLVLSNVWQKRPLDFFQLLEKVPFPTDKMREEALQALIVQNGILYERENSILISFEGLDTLNLFHAQVSLHALLGDGNHNNSPDVLSANFAKATGTLLKNMGQSSLEAAKDPKSNKFGFSIRLCQAMECRFGASIVRPLLSYFVSIPGLVCLDLNDIGRDERNGFTDADLELLLEIARSNPQLTDYRVNTNGMTEEANQRFKSELDLIMQPREDARTLREKLRAAAK